MTVEAEIESDRLFHGVSDRTLLGAFKALTHRLDRAVKVAEQLEIRVQRDRVQKEILRRMSA